MEVVQCALCYESKEIKDINSNLILIVNFPCGENVCSSCALDMFEDNQLFCPLCLQVHSGNDIYSLGSCEGQSKPPIDSSPVDSVPETPTWSKNFQKCNLKDCTNRAFCGNRCYIHLPSHMLSKSLLKAEEIAKSFANTSLADIVDSNLEISSTVTNLPVSLSDKSSNRVSMSRKASIPPVDIFTKFCRQERLSVSEALILLEKATALLQLEPNLLDIKAPVHVVGDLHGQFFDLVDILMQICGNFQDSLSIQTECSWSALTFEWLYQFAHHPSLQLLFLGDYVDRGAFSCEVLFALLSLKIYFPTKVWLLRGNHECVSLTEHFGFKEECKKKYGMTVYYKICGLFKNLPLAATISCNAGTFFACHGGLSPHLKTLSDIQRIDRVVEPESNEGLLDILWSDPLDEPECSSSNDGGGCANSECEIVWKTNHKRGCSVFYGYNATNAFLKRNNLLSIIRAHEVEEAGFKKHFVGAGVGTERQDNDLTSEIPPVITIFSAPNYCGRYGNKAAVLKIGLELSELSFVQWDAVIQPDPLVFAKSESERILDEIVLNCPYIPTSFENFVKMAFKLGPSVVSETNTESRNSMYTPSDFDRNSISRRDTFSTPSLAQTPRVSESLRGSVRRPSVSSVIKMDSIHLPAPSPAFSSSLAVDAINEIHPRNLNAVFENKNNEEYVNKLLALINNQNDDVSVGELKSRYERRLQLARGDVSVFQTLRRRRSEYSPRKAGEAPVQVDFMVDMTPTKVHAAERIENEGVKASLVIESSGVKVKKLQGIFERPPMSQSVGSKPSRRSSDLGILCMGSQPTRSIFSIADDIPIVEGDVFDDEDGDDDSDKEVEDSHAHGQSKALHTEAADASNVLFTVNELVSLRLLFSLYDRSGTGEITHDDLLSYADECGDRQSIRYAKELLSIVDLDCDNKIGFFDFLHFAERLKVEWSINNCFSNCSV